MGLVNSLRKTFYRAVTRGVPQLQQSSEDLQAQGFSSQYGQDKFVAERLNGKQNGVFFEIGAFDGVELSNTCYLERQLGWTGIAVEPSPSAFRRLQKNRHCTVINGCIAAAPGRARFLQIEGCAAMLSGIVQNFHPRHIERIDRELHAGGGKRQEVDVPCFTVAQLAADHGLGHIDYLSIDTEGGELAILRSIDFQQLDVNLITVENNYSDLAPRQLLRRAGFCLIAKIACDEVYQNERYL